MVIIMRRYATDWKLVDCLNYSLMKHHPATTMRAICSPSSQTLKINTNPFSTRKNLILVGVSVI